jgi:hypothetical protein
MKLKVIKVLTVNVLFFSIIFMYFCASWESLYREGVTEPLITLSLPSEQETPIEVTQSGTEVMISYKVNRSIEDFKNHLNPAGKIECRLSFGCNIGGLHDFPWGPAMRFDIDQLEETGILRPRVYHGVKNLNQSVKGYVFLGMSASYTDMKGKKHKGSISNSIEIPANFSKQ